MKPQRPHDEHGTTHWRADEAAMDTFTLRLPRWPILLRLLGRDPLVRTTDRIEALVVVLAVVVSLLAAPITAAVGPRSMTRADISTPSRPTPATP